MTTAITTMATSSWVMPEVGLPKPLNMRSQCSRWKNTATPPTIRSTTEVMSAGICTRRPVPARERTALAPKTPADQAMNNVNRIRGHCISMVYSFPCHVWSRRI